MKKIVFIVTAFALLHIKGFAQTGINDTIVLDSIQVCNMYHTYFSDGATKEVLSSMCVQKTPNTSISELLQHNSTALIKTYGHAGAASSVSLRGGGSNRTQISWEGFPLNSITMGDNDISLVPAQSFSYIAIDHSASATYFGSGTFGGAMELKHTPEFCDKASLLVSLTEGSFGTYKASAVGNISNKKIHYNGSVQYHESLGNFEYYDNISQEKQQRINANYSSASSIHNIHIQLHANTHAHIAVWAYYKHMLLPPIMGSIPNYKETQIDSSFKTIASIKHRYRKSVVTYKTAYLNDAQSYSMISKNNKIMRESSIQSNRFLHAISQRTYLSKRITSDIEFQANSNKAYVSNYKQQQHERAIAAIAALQYKSNRFQTNMSIRKEYNSKYRIPIIANMGMQYSLLAKRAQVRAQVGNKYRTPTFNDLYWEVWGNPNLIPESGISYELGYTHILLQKNKQVLSADLCMYHATINNMILWAPQGAIWHPYNLAQGMLQGIESRIKHSYKTTAFRIEQNFGVTYNNAHISQIYAAQQGIASEGHPLYYIPKFSANYSPNITYKAWTLNLFTNFYTKRYFAIEKYLDAFATFDASMQYSYTTKNITSFFTLQAKNITNTNYQMVRSYPMPGRAFEFSIQFLINK